MFRRRYIDKSTANVFRDIALRRDHSATVRAYRKMSTPDAPIGDLDQLWIALVVQRSLQYVNDSQVSAISGAVLDRNVDWIRQMQIGQVIFGGEYPNVADHFDAARDLFHRPLAERHSVEIPFESFEETMRAWRGPRPFHVSLSVAEPERLGGGDETVSVVRSDLDYDCAGLGYRVDMQFDTSTSRYNSVREATMWKPSATIFLTRSDRREVVRCSARNVWADVADPSYSGTWMLDRPGLPQTPPPFDGYELDDYQREPELMQEPKRNRRQTGRYRWWDGTRWTDTTFVHTQGAHVDWSLPRV